jgi:hypothetical protein
MTIRIKPIIVNGQDLFVLQSERSILGLRFWADVRDYNGTPVAGTWDEVIAKKDHLKKRIIIISH